MFTSRRDIIDRFDANFREGMDGDIVFQPRDAGARVPLTAEEYAEVMAAFERLQATNMVVTWVVLLALGAYGFYEIITEDRYLLFFLALPLAAIFSSILTLRDGIGLLLPFAHRRDQLAVRSTKAP